MESDWDFIISAIHECKASCSGADLARLCEWPHPHAKEAALQAGLNIESTVGFIPYTKEEVDRVQALFSQYSIKSSTLKCFLDPDKASNPNPLFHSSEVLDPVVFVVIDVDQPHFMDNLKKALADCHKDNIDSRVEEMLDDTKSTWNMYYTPDEQAAEIKQRIDALLALGKELNVPGIKNARLVIERDTREPGR